MSPTSSSGSENNETSLNTGAMPVQTAVASGFSQSPRRLSISTSLSLSSNLAEFNSIENNASMDFEIGPSLKLREGTDLSTAISFSKQLKGEQSLTLLNDSSLNISQRGPKLSSVISSGAGLSILLPLSKDSRQRDSLISGVSLKPSVSVQTALGKIAYRLSLTRFFHQYASATYGKSNFTWSVSQSVNLSTEIAQNISLALSGTFSNAWTYAGTLSQSFRSSEELSWDLNDKSSLSLGHTNNGSVIKADGQSSNIAIFNGVSSIIYTGFSYAF